MCFFLSYYYYYSLLLHYIRVLTVSYRNPEMGAEGWIYYKYIFADQTFGRASVAEAAVQPPAFLSGSTHSWCMLRFSEREKKCIQVPYFRIWDGGH